MGLSRQPFQLECEPTGQEAIDRAIAGIGATVWWLPTPPRDCPSLLWSPLALNRIGTYLRRGRYTVAYRAWARARADYDGDRLLVTIHWKSSTAPALAVDQTTFVPAAGARSDLVHYIYEVAGSVFADRYRTEWTQAVALSDPCAEAVLAICDAELPQDTSTWDTLSYVLELFTKHQVTDEEAEYAVGLAQSWGGTHLELVEAAQALRAQDLVRQRRS